MHNVCMHKIYHSSIYKILVEGHFTCTIEWALYSSIPIASLHEPLFYSRFRLANIHSRMTLAETSTTIPIYKATMIQLLEQSPLLYIQKHFSPLCFA